jgi:hypothetical protein
LGFAVPNGIISFCFIKELVQRIIYFIKGVPVNKGGVRRNGCLDFIFYCLS